MTTEQISGAQQGADVLRIPQLRADRTLAIALVNHYDRIITRLYGIGIEPSAETMQGYARARRDYEALEVRLFEAERRQNQRGRL